MLKKIFLWVTLVVLVFTQAQITQVEAQRPTQVECGTEIESVFSNDTQIHSYQVEIEAGTALVIYAESAASTYQNLLVDIELSTPRGNIIAEWIGGGLSRYSGGNSAQVYNVEPTKMVQTDPLPETGTYTIRVIGYTDAGSPYRFYVSCIESDGTVISVSNMVSQVQCGSIVENTFVWEPEIHLYYIRLQADDSVTLFAESVAANYENLLVDIGFVTPGGNVIAEWIGGGLARYSGRNSAQVYNVEPTKRVQTDLLPETGIYLISIIGYTDTGSNYIFQVECVLRDGTVINAGDTPPVGLTSPEEGLPSVSTSQSVFSGFGFPGVAPVDFSAGIEIPLQLGQTQTIPIGGDVALYTYEANSDEMRTLTLARLSGNISIGLTVINRDTNEIVLFGGLPSSNNLSVELTFPSSGMYAIGLFRVDTTERTGTSGAVQIMLE